LTSTDANARALNLACRTNFAEVSLREGVTRVVIDQELSNLLDVDVCMSQLSRPLMALIASQIKGSLEEAGPTIPGSQNSTLTNQILVEELEIKLNQLRAGGNDKVIELYLQGLLESAEKGQIQDLRPPQ